MKIRNVLFGYRYENGEIKHDPDEKQILLRMTDMYLNGASLKGIADMLNAQQIEYLPGVIGWNKSRVMRLLLDERYTGDDQYPAMISREIHERLLTQKNGNSNLTNTDLSDDIYKLKVPIICSECGAALKRKTSESKKSKRRLCCPACGVMIYIHDDEILGNIKKQLMRFIDTPDVIKTNSASMIIEDQNIVQINREIELALEHHNIDRDSIIIKIRELAVMRYQKIDEQYYIDQKIKAEFQKAAILYDRSPEIADKSMVDLAYRTVKEVRINKSAIVNVVLRNE